MPAPISYYEAERRPDTPRLRKSVKIRSHPVNVRTSMSVDLQNEREDLWITLMGYGTFVHNISSINFIFALLTMKW